MTLDWDPLQRLLKREDSPAEINRMVLIYPGWVPTAQQASKRGVSTYI